MLTANNDEGSKPFWGAWSLVSFELKISSGAILKPFGDSPAGLLLYGDDGYMSAQLMVAAPAPFAGANTLEATKDETDSAWRNYAGYWGKFSVDTERLIVIHHVEGGWFPNWIGTDQIRLFRFEEGKLTLEAEDAGGHASLVWRRIGMKNAV